MDVWHRKQNHLPHVCNSRRFPRIQDRALASKRLAKSRHLQPDGPSLVVSLVSYSLARSRTQTLRA
jgi:hypothetical protein